MQNVYCRIHISVQHQPTVWAFVGSLRECFRNQFAAARTHLGYITGVKQNNGSASLCRFVDSHLDKLCPRDIHNAFSHTTPLARSHFLWGTHLEHNHLIAIHQHTALLVSKISTSIGDPLVNTRKNTGLFGVFRPILRVLSIVLPFKM